MAAIYQFHFFLFWAISPILLAVFHMRNSFSAICVNLLVSFFVFWRAQLSKFKMATSGHIEKLRPKKIVMETGILSFFLSIIAHRAHLWYHLCILNVWMSKLKMVAICHSIVFRFKPFDPMFLLNVTSETLFKQYLFYVSMSCFCTYFHNDHQEK